MAGTKGTSALAGAAKYGSIGAGVGTALAPGIGTAIGAGVGALGGAIAGGLTGGRSKTQRQYDKMIRADFKRLQEGNLGLDRAQREGLQAEATRAQGALQSSQQAQIARDGLAGTNPGAYAQGQRAVADGSGERMAGANAQINALDERLRESRYNQIMRDTGLLNERDAQRRAEATDQVSTAATTMIAPIDAYIKEARARKKAIAGTSTLMPGSPEDISFAPSMPTYE